jgi:HD-GYP domain-containing protein (c-di-GMP phosphodiesterase class II)/HAMP domain-containing protein
MSDHKTTPDVSAGAAGRRFPLYLTLAAVFVTLFVVFGLALIGFFHSESKRIELLGADDLMDRIGRHMQTSIAELYLPAQSLVDVASRSAPLAGTHLEDRLATLGVLTEALRLNPHMSSIFVGYEDGEFFLVRSVGDRRVAAQALDAPKGSRFAVQSIERDGEVRGTLLFFDDALELLDTRPLPTTDFDPRDRDWYSTAIEQSDQVTTDFYVFFTTGEVGISFARRLARGGGVVGADLALADLSSGLARQKVTPSTQIAVFDRSAGVIALSTPELRVPVRVEEPTDTVTMPHLTELDDPVYSALAENVAGGDLQGRFDLDVAGEHWLASVSSVPTRRGDDVFLATLIPRAELLADVDRIRNQSVLIAIALLVIAAAIVLAVSRGLSSSLRGLAREAEQIRRFKLGRPVTVRSRIREVDELAATMGVMKHSLQQFFAISKGLSAEKDYKKLLEMILREARKVAHADGGAILITNDDESALDIAILEDETTGAHYGGTSGVEAPFDPVNLLEEQGEGLPDLDIETARSVKTVTIDDLGVGHGYDPSGACQRFGWTVSAGKSLLNVPLTDQKNEIVGILQLVNARSSSGDVVGFDPETVPSIEAISSDAAVALDLRRMLQAQKDLLDAIIHMVAGAIDAKSPYTHGHCQRVPEIAKDLARAAHDADEGPFANFELTDDEWYELHIASWLHDCGKVTTPEYVVDKATRLETISNRLHEIRTRFEVLWRDAEIDYLRSVADGSVDGADAKDRLEKRLDEIRLDYQFIAECNSGETFMNDERIERVKEISARTWTRHLDDRIGLSHDELERAKRSPSPELPVEEMLLADRVEHLVYRDGPPFGDNPHGFKMDVPEHLYNHGEIYNLCVQRGTLTAEERFKINEHIVETINMLGNLPFPKELRRVPGWAGNHHEKLDGTGYPRRLGADDLSVLARIMAVADIFEALTASDRPYKPPKKLSTSLRIMSSFRDEGHICPDLFDLFLTSGVFRKYGEEHLRPEQVDEVDISQFTGDGAG